MFANLIGSVDPRSPRPVFKRPSVSFVYCPFIPLVSCNDEQNQTPGLKGGGMVAGHVVGGLFFTNDSIMNFLSNPCSAEQARISEHIPAAPWGTCGLNFRSLAYSFGRRNMYSYAEPIFSSS